VEVRLNACSATPPLFGLAVLVLFGDRTEADRSWSMQFFLDVQGEDDRLHETGRLLGSGGFAAEPDAVLAQRVQQQHGGRDERGLRVGRPFTTTHHRMIDTMRSAVTASS
jgi:hypothetical protein